MTRGGDREPPPASVSVVTVTRRRPQLLAGAVAAVRGQCCAHVAEHIVIVDDCPATEEFLRTLRPRSPEVIVVPREPGDTTGPARLARLRNLGARAARAPWIAYLDDDNDWRPDHLHTLLETARRSGRPAVHSWQQVVNADGSPYLEERYPWARTFQEGRESYRRLLGRGVVTRGSNVYRDVADDQRGPSAIRMTDAGEWLLSTELLRSIGFCETYTAAELDALIGEDDKLLDALVDAGIPIACSGEPSLVYRLGGFSNMPVNVPVRDHGAPVGRPVKESS